MLAPRRLAPGHRVPSQTRLGRHNSSLTFPGWGACFSKDPVLDIVSTSLGRGQRTPGPGPGGVCPFQCPGECPDSLVPLLTLSQPTPMLGLAATPWHCPIVNAIHTPLPQALRGGNSSETEDRKVYSQ